MYFSKGHTSDDRRAVDGFYCDGSTVTTSRLATVNRVLTIKPGIYITGRLPGDTAGTMGAEATVLAGTGVQLVVGGTNPGNRWGDYSAMTITLSINARSGTPTSTFRPTEVLTGRRALHPILSALAAHQPRHGTLSGRSHPVQPVRRFPESMLL